MTSDRSHDQTPLVGLDSVDAPDQWDQIKRRAAEADGSDAYGPDVYGPDVNAGGGSGRPSRHLIAAAVVLVVGLAAVAFTVADRSGDGVEVSIAPAADAVFDDPSVIVERNWVLTRTVRNAGAMPPPAGTSPTLHFTASEASWRGCNSGGGAWRLVEGRIVVREWFSTVAGCAGDGGEMLMALDDFMGALLGSGAVVEVSGDRLTLTHGASQAFFLAEPGPDRPDSIGHTDGRGPEPEADSAPALPTPPPMSEGLLDELLNAERTGIGDTDGRTVGTYDTAQGQRASDAAGEHMARDGLTRPDPQDPAAGEMWMRLQEAYLTIHAVPVENDEGELVGYAGWRFFSLDEYASERERAAELIRDSGNS